MLDTLSMLRLRLVSALSYIFWRKLVMYYIDYCSYIYNYYTFKINNKSLNYLKNDLTYYCAKSRINIYKKI